MKRGFFSKMAWNGMWKNKQLYLPYLLTCIGMVMMYYIVAFLSKSELLNSIPGGDVMQSMLDLGCGVITVFATIFLFYTNSFLIRRRKKEFGLYNILGMGKIHLARILLWESLMTAGIALACGLGAGLLFSKFAELAMVNILNAEVNFSFSLDLVSIAKTIQLFVIIFFLIFLNTLRQIHLSNPIDLLHSENTGEKPPKANWLFALAGLVILGIAYYMAVTIEDPVAALGGFFIAVILVIIATYLLFVAGSVVLCKLLQKNKNYYYKTNHFVSVSSMIYRMKRNGAGLATICILCTMVLVMTSSTVCLYAGAEDSLRTRYPRNIAIEMNMVNLDTYESGCLDTIRQMADGAVADYGQTAEDVLEYKNAAFAGYLIDNQIVFDGSAEYNNQADAYSVMWQIFVLPLEEYNRLMDQNETLESGEILLYTTKTSYKEDTIVLAGGETQRVKKIVPDFVDNSVDAMQILPSMFIFVPDFEAYISPYLALKDGGGRSIVNLQWYYGFDLDCEDEMQIDIMGQIRLGLKEISANAENDYDYTSCSSVAAERAGFYGLYGGLFFLGILLGIVFIFAAVLIMYYKQISEGYEDQSRFEIMQKVGMTRTDIRSSINSQVLTVFFLPLVMAGVHLAFAFPMIHKLLILFGLINLRFLIFVTACCFIVFAFLYIFVYRITSKSYYRIVSRM